MQRSVDKGLGCFGFLSVLFLLFGFRLLGIVLLLFFGLFFPSLRIAHEIIPFLLRLRPIASASNQGSPGIREYDLS